MNLRIFITLFVSFVLLQSALFAQDAESKVYFLGIGVESCTRWDKQVMQKPFAVTDVQLIMKKTQTDATQPRSINFTYDGKNMPVKKFVGYTLYNDKATWHNIDSVVRIIAAQAQKSDIFYLCISAPDSGDHFYLPPSPDLGAKKTKTKDSHSGYLLLSQINSICDKINCRNQIILGNSAAWGDHETTIASNIFCPPAELKLQVLLYPALACTDSFMIAGKPASCFAGSIYNSKNRSLLEFALASNRECDGVVYDMNESFHDLTGMSGRFFFYTASWNTEEWKNNSVIVQNSSTGPGTQAAPSPGSGTKDGDPDLQRGTRKKVTATDPLIKAHDVDNYALIIANEDYTSPSWGGSDGPHSLKTPVNDGKDMADELSQHGFTVKLVTNATTDAIYAELDSLSLRRSSELSQVIVYYAGHGGFDTATKVGYIVPVDAPEAGTFSFKSKIISYSYLTDALDKLSAKHVMLMVDACYSGSLNPYLALTPRANKRGEAVESLEQQIANSMNFKSRCYLTSGALNTVPDGNSRNSPFAKRILELLRTKREKGEITYFEELVMASKGLRSNPQDGVFGAEADDDTGEFLIFPHKM